MSSKSGQVADSSGHVSAKRARTDDHSSDALVGNHPKITIPALCRQYYSEGSMVATAGSITSRIGNQIYIAPSGVEKEKLKPEDLFIQTLNGEDVYVPTGLRKPKKSACTPIFVQAYKRKNAGAIIHTHSMNSIRATMHYTGIEFCITHQEMIKAMLKCDSGISYRSDEQLVIPIIENAPTEDQLEEAMLRAMNDYPESSAVLVRRHGVFVWGPTLEKTKIMYEALDHLFELAVSMKLAGLDPSQKPSVPHGAYLSVTHSFKFKQPSQND